MLHRALAGFVFAFLTLTVSGCGDDDPPDIDGVWNVTATIVSSTCGNPVGEMSSEQFEIDQNGERFTIIVEGATVTGTFDGDEFALEGSVTQSEAGCTVRAEIEGSGTASSNRLSGTFSQDISIVSGTCPPTFECAETRSVVGTR